ncbi:MAG: phosphoglucosamine mutase, partial [Marmoricola sp.]|nr:phosphoglucosamine mutase [Marmoricola sp.]
MTRLFGTDGVRGLANGQLTAELALDLSVSAAHVLAERGIFAGHRPVAVVGRDTRISGQFLEAAVVAGLASAGVDVLLLGELPTPGVAWLTAELGADLGVMLSASHNAMPDNGIKFLARGGVKLDDAIEVAIERQMREPWTRPTGGDVGRVREHPTAVEEYAAHLVSTIQHPLAGIKVVLDCAQGAAWAAGPRALRDAGAEVVAICAEPDGLNINDGCGSTHLEVLQQAVLEHAADAGFALDGDADRCLAVDAAGQVVDGDQILAVLALAMRETGELKDDTVVATVMSNLGFVQAMKAAGVGVRQTKVGDRYVLEAMKLSGFTLGGEQSGHVIMSEHATTGDGTLAALHVLERMAATGQTLPALASGLNRQPQVLVNGPGVDKSRVDEDAVLAAALAEEEAALGDTGRVLLRQSGTEPLVR